MNKKKVLIMTGYYLPSVKGGGPIQSIKNIVDYLHDKFEFYIITSDRDLGDADAFDDIRVDEWVQIDKTNVYYTNISSLTWLKTKLIINEIECDIIYLNSFFNYKFSIVPLILFKLNKIGLSRIVVAPRGEFSPGAIKLKSIKKKIFILLAKLTKLHGSVVWHATNSFEKDHIANTIGKDAEIIISENLTRDYSKFSYSKQIVKNVGELSIVYISRIHPMKNLKKAIKLLHEVEGNVEFNIYGPIEDNNYWERCNKEISLLPKNIKVNYHGVVAHNRVVDIFKENHIFLFPTLGENFGHIISEAFIGGCPVLISDRTPWRKLEELEVGWDISLDNTNKFKEVLKKCILMNQNEYNNLSFNSFNYGKKMSDSSSKIQSYIELFRDKKY